MAKQPKNFRPRSSHQNNGQVSQEEQETTLKEKLNLLNYLNKDNKIFSNILTLIIFIFTLWIATGTFGEVLGIDLWHEKLYKNIIYIIILMAILLWITNKTSAETILKLQIALIVISCILLVIRIFYPDASLKSMKNDINKIKAEEKVTDIPGFEVMRDGSLRASLEPGGTISRTFELAGGGHSTPWIILPQDYYRFHCENLNPVIINDDGKEIVLENNDNRNLGPKEGERKFRFTSVQNSRATIIVTIDRLKK